MLYLHLKNVKFEIIGVDEFNKSNVLGKEFSSCSLPVFQCGEFYSDDMIDMFVYLGSQYKENKIERPFKLENISKALYPALMAIVKNKDKSKHSSLLFKLDKELEVITNFMNQRGGPYMDGNNISTIDTILFPKLYQLEAYFLKINETCPLQKFPELNEYYKSLKDRSDFQPYLPDHRSLEYAFSKQ